MFGIVVQLQGFEIKGVEYGKPDLCFDLAVKLKHALFHIFR
jgi:hypothetical protein